jgi:hypothetical protein
MQVKRDYHDLSGRTPVPVNMFTYVRGCDTMNNLT